MALGPEMERYYARGVEVRRLGRGHGPLELARTKELLSRYLPAPPAVVLDVGGGPGTYALWLARRGFVVHLVDASPLHAGQARAASGAQPDHGLASVTLDGLRAGHGCRRPADVRDPAPRVADAAEPVRRQGRRRGRHHAGARDRPGDRGRARAAWSARHPCAGDPRGGRRAGAAGSNASVTLTGAHVGRVVLTTPSHALPHGLTVGVPLARGERPGRQARESSSNNRPLRRSVVARTELRADPRFGAEPPDHAVVAARVDQVVRDLHDVIPGLHRDTAGRTDRRPASRLGAGAWPASHASQMRHAASAAHAHELAPLDRMPADPARRLMLTHHPVSPTGGR